MIEVNPVSIKLTPPYFTYLLYANHIGTEVLKTEATVPPVAFDPKLPVLDAIATRSPDGHRIFLAVVNRSQKEATTTKIHLKGWQPAGNKMEVYELNGKSWDAFNPYGTTDNVNISHRSVEAAKALMLYEFPAHSVTVLEFNNQ